MKFQKITQLFVILSLVISLSVPAALAGTGLDAIVTVTAASADAPEVAVANAYVNMYDIVLVNNQYTGKRILTLSTGKDGKAAKFTVKPGEVVDFMGFGTKEAADKAENFVSFGVPPIKNFSLDDKVAGVCHTNGVDFSKKFEAQSSTCWNDMTVTFSGPLPTPASPAAKGKNATYTVQVIKPFGGKVGEEMVTMPNTYVNMYKIILVNNEYTGKLFKTVSTGKKGKGAKFTVKPGQVVDFMGFSDKKSAMAAKNFVSNGVPPMKNFSPTYGPGLCHTNGVDFNEKLTGDYSTLCGSTAQVEVQG